MTDLIQEKRERVIELQAMLHASDYKAIKYAEGEMTDGEYEAIRKERRAWRAEINALQTELRVMGGK